MPAFGWKDPRNTFTLPVWKRIFPSLRAIHIVRHGVDVAASLARRHAAALRAATGEAVPPALAVIRDHALGVLSSRRGWTLAEALTMWEQYVEKGREECAALGERALEIRYEDLLLQPERVIAAVAKFCRVPEPAQPAALLDGLEAGRAFAFRREPELVAFAESARARSRALRLRAVSAGYRASEGSPEARTQRVPLPLPPAGCWHHAQANRAALSFLGPRNVDFKRRTRRRSPSRR